MRTAMGEIAHRRGLIVPPFPRRGCPPSCGRATDGRRRRRPAWRPGGARRRATRARRPPAGSRCGDAAGRDERAAERLHQRGDDPGVGDIIAERGFADFAGLEQRYRARGKAGRCDRQGEGPKAVRHRRRRRSKGQGSVRKRTDPCSSAVVRRSGCAGSGAGPAQTASKPACRRASAAASPAGPAPTTTQS